MLGDILIGLLIVIAINLLVLAHELGHAFAMRAEGLEFDYIAVGLPFGYMLNFEYQGWRFLISPVFLGGMVKVSDDYEKEFNELSYWSKTHIMGNGIIANVIAGNMLLCLTTIVKGQVSTRAAIFIGVLLLLSYLMLVFRRYISAYLMPIGTLLMLMFFIGSVIYDPAEAVMGPIGMIQFGVDFATSATRLLVFLAVISYGLAITNLLPLFYLDGGRIAHEVFKLKSKNWANHFETVSTWAFAGFGIWVLISEILRVV